MLKIARHILKIRKKPWSWNPLGDPLVTRGPRLLLCTGRRSQTLLVAGHRVIGGFRHVMGVAQKRWMVYGKCHNKNGWWLGVSPWHVGNLYFWGNMTVTFWLSIGFRGMFRQCHMQHDCWALVEHQLNYQNRLLKTCWYLQRIYLPIPYHQDLLPYLSLSLPLPLSLWFYKNKYMKKPWSILYMFCITYGISVGPKTYHHLMFTHRYS